MQMKGLSGGGYLISPSEEKSPVNLGWSKVCLNKSTDQLLVYRLTAKYIHIKISAIAEVATYVRSRDQGRIRPSGLVVLPEMNA